MNRLLTLLLLLGCVAGTSASAQAPSHAPADAVVEGSVRTPAPRLPDDYRIGPLDMLEIVFWQNKDLSASLMVRPDGKISLPLLNEIDAGGLTPEELRVKLVGQARRFIEDPQATVIVKQINSRNVFIMGEVAKPGTYPLAGSTTILQLIATAGGLSEFARSDQIIVVRTTDGQQANLRFNYKSLIKGKDLTQNIELHAGDTVVVP
jgi:polysaccharide export outer membrane protein